MIQTVSRTMLAKCALIAVSASVLGLVGCTPAQDTTSSTTTTPTSRPTAGARPSDGPTAAPVAQPMAAPSSKAN